MAKSPPPVEPLTSVERVRERRERILAAQSSARTIGGARARAEAELRDTAEPELRKAKEARLLGEPGAEERERKAERRVSELRMAIVQAASDSDALARIIREAEERIQRRYLADPEPFFREIEPHIADCREMAVDLVPALEKYLAAWQAAEQMWRPLAPATRAYVEKRDHEVFNVLSRDDETVARHSRPPACPVDAGLIERIRTGIPQPPALHSGYSPFASPSEITITDELGERK